MIETHIRECEDEVKLAFVKGAGAVPGPPIMDTEIPLDEESGQLKEMWSSVFSSGEINFSVGSYVHGCAAKFCASLQFLVLPSSCNIKITV